MADLRDQVMKVEALIRTCRSKEAMTFAEVEKLHARQRNMLGHLLTLYSTMLWFQVRLGDDVENGFFAFCRMLAALVNRSHLNSAKG